MRNFLQYGSIKELLTLTRKMKELWVFGPLGKDDQGSKAKEEEIDRDVRQVASLLSNLEASNMKELAEKYGATWEPTKVEENEVQAQPPTQTQQSSQPQQTQS